MSYVLRSSVARTPQYTSYVCPSIARLGLPQESVGKRITALREAVGAKKQKDAARLLSAVLGPPEVPPNRFSEWEKLDQLDRYTLAALSFLHPTDPRACLKWLMGETEEMPPVVIDQRQAAALAVKAADQLEEVGATLRESAEELRALAGIVSGRKIHSEPAKTSRPVKQSKRRA